ncbi:MAG: viperin family antiviral radical SAM protein [Firmicutes bacterium]|nr:viperin family antiviral radical SAM protein [Bacillota bacterium]
MNNTVDVINFHLTEKCNYMCAYCFAKFNNEQEFTVEEWIKTVDIVNEYFKKNAILNGRINLAGGEPLVVNYLDELIDYINSLDIKVSIITNISLLTKEKIRAWIGKVDTIGISIDSLNRETNLLIGRHSNGKTIEISDLLEILNIAKENNIKIKINTVVSKFNLHEDISSLYKQIRFDRIKLLQVRFNNDCNESAINYGISSNEFNEYSSQLKSYDGIIIESEDMMECSYVIIDPKGNLISNKGNIHKKIGSVFETNLEELIAIAEINYKTFMKRYQTEKGVNR